MTMATTKIMTIKHDGSNNQTLLVQHWRIWQPPQESATAMMRMMVKKMATSDKNYNNKKENDGTNNDTNNGTQEGKKTCKLINEDKKQLQECESMMKTKWQ